MKLADESHNQSCMSKPTTPVKKKSAPNQGMTSAEVAAIKTPFVTLKRLVFRKADGYEVYYANTVFGGFFYTIQYNGEKPGARYANLKDYTWWCNDFLSVPKNQGVDTLEEAMNACNEDLRKKVVSIIERV